MRKPTRPGGLINLKYDLCGLRDPMRATGSPEAAHKMMTDAYVKMRDALRNTGRPIVFSLCQYGDDAVWRWGAEVGGNLWRTTGDITDRYSRMAEIGFSQAGLARFAGTGHWNDPDMLEVGNGGMSTEEYRTHMSLWALLAAPLLAGNDLAAMTPDTIALLTNREVIAVDQDPLGRQGDRVSEEGPIEIWVRPLADGSMAVGIFNRQQNTMAATLDVSAIGLGDYVQARDLWRKTNLGRLPQSNKFTVPGHGVVLLKIWK